MIALVDLRATRERSADRLELRAFLQQLVGQPFLFLRFSYGDELALHFGRPERYKSPRLSKLTRGSYVIGARASSWFLSSQPVLVVGTNEPVEFSSQDAKCVTPEELETQQVLKPGARLVGVDAIGLKSAGSAAYAFGLSAFLEDGASILILPSPVSNDRSDEPAIADWEIFTPYERYLRVGPQLQWSYLPSSSPDEQIV